MRFHPTDLLYPVLNKNYDSDKQITDEWTLLRRKLEIAYMVTIFGYAAPKTDAAARGILFDFWMKNRFKDFGQIEIIDIKSEKEIEQTWSEFFVRQHYDIRKDFQHSYLHRFTRRSCEAFASMTLFNDPWRSIQEYRGNSLEEYQHLILELIESENQNELDDSVPLKRFE